METDEQLVARIQGGDILAFEVLVKRYQKPFLSFVYKILKNDLFVEDVTQEAFFKIYKNIEKIDTRKKFSTYAFEVLKNTAISQIRKNKLQVSIDDIEIPVEEKNYEKLIQSDDKNMVREALSKLSKKYKDIVGFYYFEELSYKEISHKMSIPVNTVRTRLKRGKNFIKKEIEKNYGK